MKTFVRIIAIMLIAAFSLALLASCGKSMDSIVDKIKDLDEDDYGYEKMDKEDKEDFAEEIEDEYDYELKGDIESAYYVYGEDERVQVYEFEESADAKEFAKLMKEELEEMMDDIEEYAEEMGLDDDEIEELEELYASYEVKRSGKIVIYGTKDLIKEIW